MVKLPHSGASFADVAFHPRIAVIPLAKSGISRMAD
jgi:hypothetical protein